VAELTLEEKLFLLSRNPDSGRDRATYGIDPGLGGAVLIELARRGCIQVVDGRVSRENAPGPAPELHRAALSRIESDGKDRKVRYWVERLPRKEDMQERIGVSLAEKGLLTDGRTSFLGITPKKFPRTETGDEVAGALASRVVAAVTGTDPEPAEDVALLAALLSATAETPIGGAVAASVKATEAAIMATIATVAVSGATSAGT
jgi:hypothetical protein